MKKIAVEIPDDAYEAIAAEADREYRNIPQQASFLLLTWARETAGKRQKTEKSSRPGTSMLPTDGVHGPRFDAAARS